MKCYDGDGSEGDELRYPTTVVRGQSVSCYVNSSTLWDRRLQLVVTDCRFTSPPTANQSAPLTYRFIRNKYYTLDISLTRSQAVARIADHSASQQTI